MKRWAIALGLLLSLAAVGCSRVQAVAQNEVHMGPANFKQATASVKAGQPVKFIDDPDGATHYLVIGQNGQYIPTTGAPTELTGTGTAFAVGDTKLIVFPTAGTYTVTCTIHPGMLVTITVTP